MKGDGNAGDRRRKAGVVRRAWRAILGREHRSVLPTMLCFPLAVAAILLARTAIQIPFEFYPELERHCLVQPLLGVEKITEIADYDYPELLVMFPEEGIPSAFLSFPIVAALAAVIMFLPALLGLLFRRRWVLLAIRKGYAAAYAIALLYAWYVFSLTGRIEGEGFDRFPVISGQVNAVSIFELRFSYLWLPACIVTLLAILHVWAWRRAVINVYTRSREREPAPGDVIVENIRTHGRDPAYRKSAISSVWAHLLVIVIIPLLLEHIGCIDPYKAPWGGGKPRVMMRVVKKKKKKTKRRKYILASQSSIIFRPPDLDDSKLMEEVEEETQARYTADASAAHGTLGDGPAKTPGWQDGFMDGKVRFIRLEYRGEEWDDGMDARSRADMNFLEKFRELSGGMKISDHPESHPIRYLKKYPKGFAPPFVYMTGSSAISGVSKRDRKILREYLLEGGMLFADCGGSRWDGSFRGFCRTLFPASALLPIADDDPIFQIPFGFQNGAPPLWHHGGDKALGVKHKGRWIVFYHPGDLNDAWKTGHSGMEREMAEGAFQMGVNIVYYSHLHYLQQTRKHRK